MVRAAVVLLLALFAAKVYVFSVFAQPGLDFYHFWGVPTALKLSGHKLGSPYPQSAQYAQILNEHAGTVPGDTKLARANLERRQLDLTGSPLLYMAFTVLPLDYSTALSLFRIFMLIVFLVSIATLGALYRYDAFLSATLALALLTVADPFKNDLSLGNINILLLCGLAGSLAAIHSLPARPPRRHTVVAGAVLTVLAGLTLLKPLVLLPCLALAIGLGLGRLRRSLPACVGMAALPTLGFLLLPCLYFGSATVWGDWLRALDGPDHRRLFYPIEQGNFSFALLASDWLGVPYLLMAAGLAIGLVASSAVVAATAQRPEKTAESSPFCDPHLQVSIGLVATIALAPLAWVHYYLLLLIPALWLASLWPRARVIGILGLTALLMSSGAGDFAFSRLDLAAPIPWTRALSWVPAWFGILLVIRTGTLSPPIAQSGAGGRRPPSLADSDPGPT